MTERLYSDLATWWPLLSAPADYEEEAAFFLGLFREHCRRPLETLLELGSGGGNTASFLKGELDCTLVDLSEGMLEVSRRLNPECAHQQGDMRTVRLGETFDAVFLHDAVCYMTSEGDVEAALRTVWEHTAPGGVAVVMPDFVRENLELGTEEGGHDELDGDGRPTGRGLRYLAWVSDPDPEDQTYLVDYAYRLRSADGSVEVVHDRHVEGLFPRATWVTLLERCGFEVEVVPFEHSEIEDERHEVFVARRPETPAAG